MFNWLKKNSLTLLIVAVVVTSAWAVATTFTNLRATGTLQVDGRSTLTGRTTLGAPLTPYIRTLAQLNALTPDTTYQFVICSDCTRSAIAIASGSVNAGSWVIAVATGPFVGSTLSGLQHIQ
jgi:hypothetical protein